ncbi:MAG: (2Fe-2S)-binding protein [Planctomycetota bacterium]
MKRAIQFTLNGKAVNLSVDGERPLLWVLRADLGITGCKFGCGEGHCGACTVLVGKEALRSCQLSVNDVEGAQVTTIEGLERERKLHPLQQAFVAHNALQCGFCTPGMIMNAYGLLLGNPQPSRAQILESMDDNLCRCGAHMRIVAAIESAAHVMRAGGDR